jgi:alpha-mannosidase
MSAWHINSIQRRQNLVSGATVELADRGPVFARFRVRHEFRSSSIEEDVVFYNDFPRVDFEIRIDWRERGSPETGVPQLKVCFASCAARATARFEGPFCVTARPADGQEQPTQKWVDVTGSDFGITVFNDGRYGSDAQGGRLGVTLLRNPYSPDPETDNGIHRVRLAVQSHGAGTDVAAMTRDGMAFNRALMALSSKGRPAPPMPGLRVKGGSSIVCTSLRQAEHSDALLLRFYETSGRRAAASITLGEGMRSAREVDFLERPTGGRCVLRRGWVNTVFRPHEIKTLLVRLRRCPQ